MIWGWGQVGDDTYFHQHYHTLATNIYIPVHVHVINPLPLPTTTTHIIGEMPGYHAQAETKCLALLIRVLPVG